MTTFAEPSAQTLWVNNPSLGYRGIYKANGGNVQKSNEKVISGVFYPHTNRQGNGLFLEQTSPQNTASNGGISSVHEIGNMAYLFRTGRDGVPLIVPAGYWITKVALKWNNCVGNVKQTIYNDTPPSGYGLPLIAYPKKVHTKSRNETVQQIEQESENENSDSDDEESCSKSCSGS